MEDDPHSDKEILEILKMKKVAVVGMSKNPDKAAHYVPKYLAENGYDITPVNPNSDVILKKQCYDEITDVPDEIDIVDVFRPSDQILSIIKEAIKKKPKVIWLQEGIHNEEAEQFARDAGIDVVFNRCMLAEHRRLVICFDICLVKFVLNKNFSIVDLVLFDNTQTIFLSEFWIIQLIKNVLIFHFSKFSNSYFLII